MSDGSIYNQGHNISFQWTFWRSCHLLTVLAVSAECVKNWHQLMGSRWWALISPPRERSGRPLVPIIKTSSTTDRQHHRYKKYLCDLVNWCQTMHKPRTMKNNLNWCEQVTTAEYNLSTNISQSLKHNQKRRFLLTRFFDPHKMGSSCNVFSVFKIKTFCTWLSSYLCVWDLYTQMEAGPRLQSKRSEYQTWSPKQ